jgi:hypothetical protein
MEKILSSPDFFRTRKMEISGISSKIKKLNFNQNQYPTIVVAAKVVVVMLANNQQITKKQRRDFLFFKKQNMYVVKRWPQRAGNVRQNHR